VRVDQLGFSPGETKIAYLLTATAQPGAAFIVVDSSGDIAFSGLADASRGRWNKRYGAVQPLDLSALTAPGTYRIVVAGPPTATSPPFRVAGAGELFRGRVAEIVSFFQAQRDGGDVVAGPLQRKPAHRNDRALSWYAWPHYESADSDVIVGSALIPLGGPRVDLEGGWVDAGDFVKFTHTTAYADTLLFASERESSWRDDLELAAAELALAGQKLGDPRAGRWLKAGERWARAFLAREAGEDTLNLYDTSALAHADLRLALQAVDAAHPLQARLLGDMRAQLERGLKRSRADPFAAGAIYDDFDAAPHTFGLVATALLYRSLTNDPAFDAFATSQRDWALGANAWGESLMIGVGQDFPRCPQHVVANLSGRQDGKAPVLLGAVVNGPNDAGLFADGLDDFFSNGHACPPIRGDALAAFTGHGSRFVADVSAWQTVEPAIDFDAAAARAFALSATSSP
jgi:hypothetical protein